MTPLAGTMLVGRGIEPSGARLLSYPPRRSAKNVNSLRVLVRIWHLGAAKDTSKRSRRPVENLCL